MQRGSQKGIRQVLGRILARTGTLADIIVFGSAARGKARPGDIDILLFFKEEADRETEYSIRRSLRAKGFVNTHVTSRTLQELFSDSFLAREGVFSDGFSIAQGRALAEGMGYRAFHIFKYTLAGLPPSKRSMFYYALHGRRGSEGLLSRLSAIKYSEGLLLAPSERSDELATFLEDAGISHSRAPVLVQADSIGLFSGKRSRRREAAVREP